MADEQIIIEVVVDNSAARKALTAQTKAVDDLKNANKEILAVNKELNKDYKANSNEINRNNAQIAQNNVELGKQKQAQKASAQQLKTTNNSINAQKAALSASKLAIGDVNKATKEGQKEYKRLEDLILSQTEALSGAEQAQGTFTRSVGKYEEANKGVIKSINGLKSAVNDLKAKQDALDVTTKKGKKEYQSLNVQINNYQNNIDNSTKSTSSFTENLSEVSPAAGGAIEGLKGMTKSALAFIATPIGLVLAAVAAAVALVSNAMNRNEESSNKVNKVVGKLAGIFNFLLKALEPVGEFLIDGIVFAFELAAQAADDAIGVISDGLKFLGFDEAAASVKNFKDEIDDFVEGAGKLADMEAELVKAQRIATKVMLDFQKEAEILRQIRDDESKSFQKRIQANKDLGDVLNKQLKEEKAIAELGLEVANERIVQEGETVDALDARAEALTNISDIEERITGQRSEQLVNENSLRRDQAAKNKEAADSVKSAADKKAALDKSAADKKIEDDKLEADRNQAALIKEQEDILSLETFRRTQAAITTDDLISLEEFKLSETLRIDALRKEQDQISANEEILLKEQTNAKILEIDQRDGEESDAIKKKSEDEDKALADAKIGLAGDVSGAIAGFAEEGTALAKVAGIAQVGISTAQAIMNVFATVPIPVAPAAASVVGGLGLAQAANIAGIFEDGGITKFANGGLMDGGIFEGASHANGGVKFSVGGKINEAEGGEAIISKRATSMFKPQLSAMNVAGGGKKFANGGIPLAASSTSSIDSAISGENSVANQLSNQVPVQVAVTDINRTQSNVSVKQVRSSI